MWQLKNCVSEQEKNLVLYSFQVPERLVLDVNGLSLKYAKDEVDFAFSND
jgi:hypothetical protein